MAASSNRSIDDDDVFADSRMSFGDHIDELRTCLVRALWGLAICMTVGFVLDGIGSWLQLPWLGVGRPVMKLIVDPVETQVRNFYFRKLGGVQSKLPTTAATPDEIERVQAKLKANDNDLTTLTAEENSIHLRTPRSLPIELPVEPFVAVFGPPKDPTITTIKLEIRTFPAHFNAFASEGEALLGSKRYLTTLSAQESLVVYFKVSLLSGVVLASPWIFYQIWSFVAAGLYPREKAYVYKFLPFSICLFLAGVFICQFLVLPGAVKALLGFNTWIDTDPDLRLSEWLGFALILPLVFGVSFQTPMVMYIMNRLGLFGWEDYLSKWRYALMILAVFSMVITPTPDAVTMLYLLVPMFGLYMVGIFICWAAPARQPEEDEVDTEIAV